MTSEWNVRVTALAVMVGIGIAAPAAAYVAMKMRASPNVAHDTLVLGIPMDMESAIGALPPTETLTIVKVPEVKVVVSSAAALVGHVRRAEEPRCSWHYSQTLSSGRVRICDTPRDKDEAPRRLLEPVERRAPERDRDLPSPTGLIR